MTYVVDTLQVLFWNADGKCQTTFHPFCGVTEELKAFFSDVTQAKLKVINDIYNLTSVIIWSKLVLGI